MPVSEQPLVRIGQPPAKKRRSWYRSRWLLLAAPVAAVALFAIGGLGIHLFRPQLENVKAAVIAPSFAPQPFSVSGFMTLELGGFSWSSTTDTCTGTGGYDDIHFGTQVVITDPSSNTIALGQLGYGIPRRDPNNTSRATECRFPFKVAGVPGGHQFYGIEISHRGKLQYARDEIVGPLELVLN